MIRWLILVLCWIAASPVGAETRIPGNCVALADAGPEKLQTASFGDPLPDQTIRISYLDHSSFLLETSGGLTAVTDYTGTVGAADLVPDVVTMNNYHDSHWTAHPDPRIPHVLRGWPQDGRAADHELDLGEMLVRNVTTDTHGPFGEGARKDGNSIFIFEVAGLCIGHLGHLHQEPSPAQYGRIGRLDVVMVPVDGAFTMDQAAMVRVVRRLNPRVILPMHWFDPATLASFLALIGGDFPVEVRREAFIVVSSALLPARATVVVLTPHWLD